MTQTKAYEVRADSTTVVKGTMKSLNLVEDVEYAIDFDPNSGTDQYRRISSLKLWLIDASTGALYDSIPSNDIAVYNGTELIPGSMPAAESGYYRIENTGGVDRIFLSSTIDGQFRFIVPALPVTSSSYVTRQDSIPLVLHVEFVTKDGTKGTYQIPLTLRHIGRTAYSGI